jgi:hypothetical protein
MTPFGLIAVATRNSTDYAAISERQSDRGNAPVRLIAEVAVVRMLSISEVCK